MGGGGKYVHKNVTFFHTPNKCSCFIDKFPLNGLWNKGDRRRILQKPGGQERGVVHLLVDPGDMCPSFPSNKNKQEN